MSALSGERLGPYRLYERLGEGGMGVVYLGSDSDDRPVAVKILRQGVPGEANARRRLAREVETMRRVHSPFVAEVVDADIEGDSPYIVTRYVAGRTLEDVVAADGPLAGEALAALARGLAAAITAIHSAGVVHRDLKPSNVMLVGPDPVVIDFGIAQAPDATRLTMTGMFMGTPGYLAPEVIEGELSGPPADVHSFAATLAYAATGRPPFGTGQYQAIFYRIVHGRPDLDTVPTPLLPVLTAALDRQPAARPTAARLTELTSGLDPAALVPSPPGAALASAQATADGLAPIGSAAAPEQARPSAVPTSVDLPAAPPRRTPARRVADDFADLLPPVRYGAPPAPAAGPVGQAAMRPAWPLAGTAQTRPGQRPAVGTSSAPAPARLPLVLATMAGLVAVSVLLPVAGAALALVTLVLLSAADVTVGWLSRRRGGQGRKRTDPVSATAFYPWAVLRSALRFLALAPVAILCAAAAAVLAVLATGADQLPRAAACAAGAFVACYAVGPGSRSCRRPLSRCYGRLTRSGPAAVLCSVGAAAVVVALVGAAVTVAPGYWPADHLGNQLQTVATGHSLLHQVTTAIGDAGGRLGSWLGSRF